MKLKLNLHKTHFDLIKSWNKTIESRLFDEKRKKIKIWDEIVFVSREDWSIVKTKVLKLYKSENFLELSKIIDLEKTWTNTTKSFLESLEIYYSKEKQENFWVIGIEFIIK
jgi:ASC-1-like (ASCH) protein